MVQEELPTATTNPSVRPPFGWTFTPHALIFISSAWTMVVEVVAAQVRECRHPEAAAVDAVLVQGMRRDLHGDRVIASIDRLDELPL